MRIRIRLFAVAVSCFGCAYATYAQSAPAAPDPLTVSIDAQQTFEPVSQYQFGMFIEHLRSLIYRSLWSEMLDDRKFYFPISSKDLDTSPQPPPGSRYAICSFANGGRWVRTKLW